ncbi:MAG: hypothetical protein GAK37_03187 [Pseudomonas sp.]|nr:MAG: hypothetical protein GAK37_03187 [Pseudomonas sp.]
MLKSIRKSIVISSITALLLISGQSAFAADSPTFFYTLQQLLSRFHLNLLAAGVEVDVQL